MTVMNCIVTVPFANKAKQPVFQMLVVCIYLNGGENKPFSICFSPRLSPLTTILFFCPAFYLLVCIGMKSKIGLSPNGKKTNVSTGFRMLSILFRS
jgi:hypothetical protein